jgi:DNA ligase-1
MPAKFKPMLAAKLSAIDITSLSFPLLVSPKLDGIRCLTTSRGAVSRNLKPIANCDLRAALNCLPRGLDGELVIPGEPFCEISSVVMSIDVDPKLVEYWVFDSFGAPGEPFTVRTGTAQQVVRTLATDWVRYVPQVEVSSYTMVERLEKRWLDEAYEGIILRSPTAPYKYGRSTVKEQGLMKLKRFSDSEAVVIGFVPLNHNENEATKDALGRTKRSSAKAGKVPLQMLGALRVRDVMTGVEFDLGCGWSESQRRSWWKVRHTLINKIVKYKHQASGAKDKPRFPVFLGVRDERDM